MSNVEDLAKEFLKKLVSHTTLYKDTIDELEVYEPDDVIWAYKDGYHQAEKDLEITIDDIMKLDALLIEMWNTPSNEDKYQEVLKRFKTKKNVEQEV